MMTRRETAETLYPFTPRAEASRAYLAGIKDIMCLVEGAADPAPPDVNRDGRLYWGFLYSLVVGVADNTYTFYAVSPTSIYKLIFIVPASGGLIRVADSVAGHSFLVVDTGKLFRSPLGTHIMYSSEAEVEPARFVWRLDEVTSISLANEFRNHDPQARVALPADTVIKTVSADGETLSLINGYNCSLSYNETEKTLYIEAAPGEGEGLPSVIPWDTAAPAIDTGILTVNGINDGGDARINGTSNVLLSYDDAEIILTVRKDTSA